MCVPWRARALACFGDIARHASMACLRHVAASVLATTRCPNHPADVSVSDFDSDERVKLLYRLTDRVVAWVTLPPQPADVSVSDFYSDERVKLLYRLNLCQLANRVSSRSGVKYKDMPNVFAWDLISEPRRAGSDVVCCLLGGRHCKACLPGSCFRSPGKKRWLLRLRCN